MGETPPLPDDRRPLIDIYYDWVLTTIGPDGFSMPYGIVLDADGKLVVLALAVPPEQAYRVMIQQMDAGAREAIFALDRFAKPGQGTELGDLLAGWHLTRATPQPFIIEYQYEPRVVKAIDRENAFWNAALHREMVSNLRHHLGMPR